ncbi:uncharacterized protein B0I36DRAFT_343538 [Microdochium trichocladiopsis]|uniref:Uncharacterized protein n=1 Tax=Microdochium trichocladiopsis TaxID=1682393 RepID=A0A9P8YFZ4_9PEZI|nr:uncharacterized protein B0I36DRAFT_343538 [Microdochium trichocladiopsis]KAH7039679.1 hypothetical protein B0I36DRAFT_343538 [Microdochium trichocladiopsis]
MSTFVADRSHYEPDSMPPPPATAAGRDSPTVSERIESASSGDHVVEKTAPVEKLSKRQKVKRHCARFWLWWLIGTIIFLAILLPIIFKVILPAIVQDIVGKQEMPVLGGSLIALSPTQMKMTLKTSLDTPLAADLDPVDLYLYNKNTTQYTPFTNLTIPPQHINHYTEVDVTEQTVTISNLDELIKFFNNVFDEEEVELSVRGDTTVHLGALNAPAHIDKTVTVKALNKLKGFAVTDLKLLAPPDEEGNNLHTIVNLPNSGVLTLGLGDLGLNLLSGTIPIGHVTCKNVLLAPGDNAVECNGSLYYKVLFDSLPAIMASQASALMSGNIELGAQGNSTTINGEHIPYVEEVLKTKVLRTNVPIGQLLADVITGFTGGDFNIGDLVGDSFNATLIQTMVNHWDEYDDQGSTSGNTNTTENAMASRKREAARKKKVATRDGDIVKRNMMWSMLKMGLALSKR